MSAEVVIRGGTVIDGSGAPGRAADVAISDGVITEIGPNLRGEQRARRVGLRGHARLHRHPHALRRAGLLGSGVAAVVVPGRHHRRRGELRLRDRTDPPRAPGRHRGHARERRGHGRCDPERRAHVGLRDVPRVPGFGPAARHAAQLHRVRRPLRAAALRHGRRRLRARRDRRRDRADVRPRPRRDRGGRGRVLDELLVRASRGRRQAGPQPLRRTRGGRRACSSRPARRARVWCSSRRASSARTPTSTSGSPGSGGRSPTRCSRRRAGSTSSRSSCTSRGWPTARTSGPR